MTSVICDHPLAMEKNKLKLSKLLAGVLLWAGLAPLSVQAETLDLEYISLLEAVCVSTGPGRWRKTSEDVSVNRQVYTSVLFMGPGTQYSGLTCRIRPENPGPKDYNFQTLNLQFGMRDNDWKSPSATVKIYLDGKAMAEQAIGPGEKASVSLPITNVSNVAIETICNSDSRYCDRVYFFDAGLEPILPPQIDKTQEIPAPNPEGTSVPIPPPPNTPQSNPYPPALPSIK
jgi:hypothetical protein